MKFRQRMISTMGGLLATAAMVVATVSLGGCELLGVTAEAFTGMEKKVNIEAVYHGLQGQTVAVMVSAPAHVNSRYPNAESMICSTMSKRIIESLAGVRVIDPRHLIDYQEKHPDWISLPYSKLAYQLNIDRVILVDVGDYSMTEPGNKHLMQGTIVANVSVIEAPTNEVSTSPAGNDGLAFQHTIEARYPKKHPTGLVNVEEQVMELATVTEFTNMSVGLFYDHEVKR